METINGDKLRGHLETMVLSTLEHGEAHRFVDADRRVLRREQRVQLRRVRAREASRSDPPRLARRRALPERFLDAPLLRDRAGAADRHSCFPRRLHPVADGWPSLRSSSALHVQGIPRRCVPNRLPRSRTRAGANVGRARRWGRQAAVDNGPDGLLAGRRGPTLDMANVERDEIRQ